VDDEFLAITSLSRAVGGGVQLTDVGSLFWVILRQIVPCDAMALFMPDPAQQHLVIRYAAGEHASIIAGVTRRSSSGIAGWALLNRRSVLNAEPVFDLGFRASASPALRSSVVVPLVYNGTVVAVLALYSKELLAFTDEHVTMLEVLGPRLALPLSDATLIAEAESAAPRKLRLQLIRRS
jgi:GAF domain-containing protein